MEGQKYKVVFEVSLIDLAQCEVQQRPLLAVSILGVSAIYSHTDF
jgi:hypothetical protein